MKKLLLGLGLWLGLIASASAQCVAVGGINTVPQTGMNCLSEPSVGTYAATGIGIAIAASATDIACITGSATKVIRVQMVRVSGTASTGIIVPAVITRHTVANTGGTAATGTALPTPAAADSNNSAATATTTAYTANPTVDATSTIVDAGDLALTKTDGTNGFAAPYTLFDWSARNYMQAPVLRGVAQQICVNLNATSPSTGLANVSFRWTEAAQ